jgi:hypothetical protein
VMSTIALRRRTSFNAASSLTTTEGSRAVSLVTSFGSCGPTFATTGGAKRPCSRTHPGGRAFLGASRSSLGLRAGPARGGTSIARAASPGKPDGGLGRQPHGVGLRQGPSQSLQPPQVLLQVRTVPLLEAPLLPRQQVPRPLCDPYLFDQLLASLFHPLITILSVCA